jgi:hypothetical protein
MMVMEEQLMKRNRLISMGALALFLGVLAPTYAQQDQGAKPEQHEKQAKPEKQKAAKPDKQEQHQAKGQQRQQQQRGKTANQNEQRQARTQQDQERGQQHQQQSRGQQREQQQGHWARNGQRDSRGHEYSESRFGPEHHARFEENGGRNYNGRREYSYGGYWFYADAYPPWFYQQDVYFVMGPDGLWYAVAYSDPSLVFQVNIE